MIIGDQPSESPWPPEHPNRQLFYGTLKSSPLGYAAHLTDVIKRRGPGSESARREPPDMPLHLDILRSELEIVQPTRIIALGGTAERHMRKYFPELEPRLAGIIHWGTRTTHEVPDVPTEFRRQLRRALTCTQREVFSSRARPNVRYKVLKSLAGDRCPRQMRMLHQIIAKNTSELNPDLAEPNLMLLVFDAARSGALLTRQHPWRIWQYYRPRLVEQGYIRETVDAPLT